MRRIALIALILASLSLAACGSSPRPTAATEVAAAPSPTTRVEATATPLPTATPEPTATVEPTPEPEPSATVANEADSDETAAGEWTRHEIPDGRLAMELPERFFVLDLDAATLDDIEDAAEGALPSGALEGLDLSALMTQNIRLYAVDVEGFSETGGTFAPNVNVLVQPIGEVPLELAIAGSRASLEAVGATNIEADETLEVDGEAAGSLEYDLVLQLPGGSREVHIQQVVVIVEGELYVVTFAYLPEQAEGYAGLVEEITARIEIMDAE